MIVGLATGALAQLTDEEPDGKIRAGDAVLIPAGETFEGDLYVFGGEVIVDGRVTRDLVACAGEVTIGGAVEGGCQRRQRPHRPHRRGQWRRPGRSGGRVVPRRPAHTGGGTDRDADLSASRPDRRTLKQQTGDHPAVATVRVADDDHMARVIRVLAVIVTTVVGLLLVGWAYVFGRCEGWKDTGSCPRVPLWDWEMFWMIFWAGLLPAAAIRLGRHRLLRGALEAIAAGIVLGALVVVVSGY